MDINFGWHCTPGQLSTSRGGQVGLLGSLWQSDVSQPHGAALLGTTRPAQAASGTPLQPLARPQLLWDQAKLQLSTGQPGGLWGQASAFLERDREQEVRYNVPMGPSPCPGEVLALGQVWDLIRPYQQPPTSFLVTHLFSQVTSCRTPYPLRLEGRPGALVRPFEAIHWPVGTLGLASLLRRVVEGGWGLCLTQPAHARPGG